eukprot:CAMPEP_0174761140 /NCGR_PEP_ID=MMETSP1094-20130205/109124_1 /TAXON_ID=156173 /ORGANISM="Chrysochromulina brevifilum, Strain UTEX LB 985" /LENGTH=341 /DNA_ID=CAMNT_0015967087 /DNA_START=151 /DNA_END=1177 /DNA_ORIENTATION=-
MAIVLRLPCDGVHLPRPQAGFGMAVICPLSNSSWHLQQRIPLVFLPSWLDGRFGLPEEERLPTQILTSCVVEQLRECLGDKMATYPQRWRLAAAVVHHCACCLVGQRGSPADVGVTAISAHHRLVARDAHLLVKDAQACLQQIRATKPCQLGAARVQSVPDGGGMNCESHARWKLSFASEDAQGPVAEEGWFTDQSEEGQRARGPEGQRARGLGAWPPVLRVAGVCTKHGKGLVHWHGHDAKRSILLESIKLQVPCKRDAHDEPGGGARRAKRKVDAVGRRHDTGGDLIGELKAAANLPEHAGRAIPTCCHDDSLSKNSSQKAPDHRHRCTPGLLTGHGER